MTNRERIEDNYEDALFAMWMDDFAQRRGAKLIEENERLKNDPEAAVPEYLQQRNLNLIFRELRRNAHTFTFKKIGKAILHFAAAVVIMAALFGCAYALSPEFRAGTLNVLLELDEKAASFQLGQNESETSEMPQPLPTVTVGWLPDGYVPEPAVADRLQTTIDCANAEGDLIRVRVFTEDQTFLNLDTEDADLCEDITIQGQPALLVEKEGMLRILWADETSGTYIYVASYAVDKTILVQLAENISISW